MNTGMFPVFSMAILVAHRMIQQNTFDIMSACSEVDRLIASRNPSASDVISRAVRKAVDTQQCLERLRPAGKMEARYSRLAENFGKASKKLEEAMRRAGEQRGEATQLRVLHEITKTAKPNVPTRDYVSAMEEGTVLTDLTRIKKDMTTLQDVYVALSEASASQSSRLSIVQEKLGQAGHATCEAVRELNRAKDRMDYWTRMKVYAASGVVSICLLLWLV